MKDCRYYDMCFRCGDECDGEPECPHRRTCPFYSPMPDRDALIELADEIRALNENADIHLFGTVRIGDTTLLAIERRIREAVGA